MRSPGLPVVSASTTLEGHDPTAVLDNDAFTSWQSGAVAPEQWLQLDFGRPREYGGLVIDASDHIVRTTAIHDPLVPEWRLRIERYAP